MSVSFDALDTLLCTWAHWPISIWFSSYFLTLSDIFILVVVTCTHCSIFYSTYIFNMSAYNTYINCLLFILLQIWSQNRTRGFCKGVFLYTTTSDCQCNFSNLVCTFRSSVRTPQVPSRFCLHPNLWREYEEIPFKNMF